MMHSRASGIAGHIGLIAIQQECNTFVSAKTTLGHFREDTLLTGDAIAQLRGSNNHEMAGFLEGLRDTEYRAAPLLMAVAVPRGVIEDVAAEHLLKLVDEALIHAPPLDGLLVAPHGSAVSESHADFDGHWLTWLRRRVGREMPIVCTLDPHANVSTRMIDACDATIAYRTNPHIDQRQRGVEAAHLLLRTLRGQIKPTQAMASPPVAMNIERQHTSAEPCASLYQLADDIREREKVLSVSVFLGFPYADVPEMGSGFCVVTDDDPDLASRYANELAAYLLEHRARFDAQLIAPDEALLRARDMPKPVLLLDMGDNVGGGSAGDGTTLVHALERDVSLRGLVTLYDPPSAAVARHAGVGARLELTIGGKTDTMHGDPLRRHVTVEALHAGTFHDPAPRHGGRCDYDMGLTAIVRTDRGQLLQLTSRRILPFSGVMLTACGIDPSTLDVIVAKGVNAPLAGFESMCPSYLRVNTPGSTTADMRSLPYRRIRRPLFPLDDL